MTHCRSCFCIYSGWDGECLNSNIKRSFFGLGMRVCVKAGDREDNTSTDCNFYEKPKRSSFPPSPLRKNK